MGWPTSNQSKNSESSYLHVGIYIDIYISYFVLHVNQNIIYDNYAFVDIAVLILSLDTLLNMLINYDYKVTLF